MMTMNELTISRRRCGRAHTYRITDPTGEVDQTTSDTAVGALQVHDDRLTVFELVSDFLGLIETAGTNGVRLHGNSWDTPQRRLRRRRRLGLFNRSSLHR